MPLNYADPFGRLGGAAGGAAGGGAMGLLSSLLEPLDYVRQSAWNLIKKPVDAISQGDPSQLLGMIPGLAGLAGTVVGGPWGGAAASGLAQGIGKAVAPEQFEAPKVSDLTGTEDFLPNLLVGAITDPLTYAGGLGGARAGAKAGREFGTGLETAARARGPQWGGGAEKAMQMTEEGLLPAGMDLERLAKLKAYEQSPEAMARGHKPWSRIQEHMNELRANPEALAEFEPGSRWLGSGAESAVYGPPSGGATAYTRSTLNTGQPLGGLPLPRPDIPEVLQAARSVPIPGSPARQGMRVEHMPLMDILQRGSPAAAEVMPGIDEATRAANVAWWDARADQLGRVQAPAPNVGEHFITDAGSIWPQRAVPASAGLHLSPAERDLAGIPQMMGALNTDVPIPRVAEMSTQQPGWLKSKLLDLLGSREGVRREIAENVQVARGGNPVPPMPANYEIVPVRRPATSSFSEPGSSALAPTDRPGPVAGVAGSPGALPSQLSSDVAGISSVRPSEMQAAEDLLRKQLGMPPSQVSPASPIPLEASSGVPRPRSPLEKLRDAGFEIMDQDNPRITQGPYSAAGPAPMTQFGPGQAALDQARSRMQDLQTTIRNALEYPGAANETWVKQLQMELAQLQSQFPGMQVPPVSYGDMRNKMLEAMRSPISQANIITPPPLTTPLG